ncbi:4'-phosphopantetheinyl transferase superfamily protein [Aeromonas caviae]|uniref:4'-phosphopantetheinyl transferase superfamily protein n=1 Tax=Aeromonas caviae TaxID=648 RepID=A0AA42RCZ5_AERCA|nr:4'-phosphopantetheinyl transferase superfamily protein [Aeromonas caviae]MDH0434818.1 4'-phosphopantetheinyl transferase superfamily protein [Aeromonas caviae]MDH0937665.1 4'-phosphopantetheinyl transferase superfamily protein [Aeromonas caviae]MDH1398498.1 4'-phosphopantetheinyl transferase superfamily protein [Aeromonas caviae]MDH1506975.1 4'-phosphopantetheinyl transferase superfamily protein [Aeromonas caviae]MDH1805649.1 4'-phosphopantetheinyl transferase superfamily protein [Aeromonas
MLSADLYLLNTALVDTEQLIGLSSGLSPEEYRHWHEIRQPGRQREYLLGRVLLRRLLAERLHCPAGSLAFHIGEHGKPMLCNHHWQFNLSHSGDWLVLALCREGPLGVDIEMGLRRRPILPLAERFYAPGEYLWLRTLPVQEQDSAFYRLWSRKEAVLKAHGDGISAGLDKICFLPEQAWQLNNHLDNRHYEIRDWPAGSGWLSLAAPTRRVDAHLLDARLNSTPLDPMLIHTIFRESAS